MIALLGRAQELSRGAHGLYRLLVEQYLATGALPTAAALAAAPGLDPGRVDALLDELVAGDWAGRDQGGALTVLYPFSVARTGVRVWVRQVERHAMCAIDALGVAPMLGEAVAIAGACPHCAAPLLVSVTPAGVASSRPAGVAVVHRRAPGPAHRARCPATRFACSEDHGYRWLTDRGGGEDVVLPLDAAFARGRALFGDAYAHGRADTP